MIAVRCDEMSAFARTIMEGKNYAHYLSQQKRHETWPEVAERVSRCVVEPYLGADFTGRIRQLIAEKKFMPGGRYLYAAGRSYPQVNSCFLFRAHDSREGWADIWYKCGHSLMTGGGVGVVYSDLREEGALVHGLGGRSTGPIALAKTVNEQGRYIRQGGSRRSAIWAGLLWKHKDIFKFISVKDWDDYTREGKRRDFNFPAPMDTTNISVILDDEFFEAYHDETHPLHFLAADVYWAAIRHMLMTGEPGFSVDIGANAGENLRNACLASDTLIAVADGRGAVPIKDLVGTSTPVYASDTAGNIKVGTLRNVRVTRRNAELMRITTSDGGSFRVTPDHKVMLANGMFVEAISLRLGTSLAAYCSGKTTVGEQVVTDLGEGNWEDVYDGTVDDLHCFAVVTREDRTGAILHNCTEVVSRDDQDMCLAVGTRVLTNAGYVPVEDLLNSSLQVASKVDGRLVFQTPTAVIDTGVKEVYRLELSDRRCIRLTGNHPVLTDLGWKRVDALSVTDHVHINATAVDVQPSPLDSEYYMLGWLVGDGWFSETNFGFVFGSAEDKESEEAVVGYMRGRYRIGFMQEQQNGVRCYHVDSRQMREGFTRFYGIEPGRAPYKRVPTSVYTASISKKTAFLAGLFAADGSAKRRRQAGLASASAQLLRDVQLLLDELGIYSHICCIDPAEGEDHNPNGWLTVAGTSVRKFANLVGFGHHSIKQKLLEERLAGTPTHDSMGRQCRPPVSPPTSLRVLSITHVGQSPVYDVSLPEHHHFIAEGMIVHNCNLGSINLSRFDNLDDFTEAVELTTAFLLCGTIYSRLPIPSMDAVRTKNRRLGLGLMGCHEWMLKRGYRYGEVDELAHWMRSYTMSGAFANRWADRLGVSRPVATRSIAPTGTISIVAETTSGVEPIFATALKRRYLDGNTWKAQYIVDPTARRLIEGGTDPSLIEDSLTLAEDVERRVSFQVWLQTKVDHGIASTLNLPPWGSSINNEGTVTRFGTTLLKYLPQLRGITAYPDGARDGQPLVKVPYHEAIGKEGVIFEDSSEANCPSGVCGI